MFHVSVLISSRAVNSSSSTSRVYRRSVSLRVIGSSGDSAREQSYLTTHAENFHDDAFIERVHSVSEVCRDRCCVTSATCTIFSAAGETGISWLIDYFRFLTDYRTEGSRLLIQPGQPGGLGTSACCSRFCNLLENNKDNRLANLPR